MYKVLSYGIYTFSHIDMTYSMSCALPLIYPLAPVLARKVELDIPRESVEK